MDIGMKKKIIYKILAVSLSSVVLLTACGNRSDQGADISGQEIQTEEQETGKENSQAVESEADQPEQSGAESDVETAAEPEEVIAYVKGISTVSRYESEFLGLSFTAPEYMILLSEEELNEVMGITLAAFSDDVSELQLEYAEMETVYEMMCSNADGSVNMVITVEKIPSDDYTIQDCVEMISDSLTGLTSLDYTTLDSDQTTDIAGMEYAVLRLLCESNGMSMNQDYYVRLAGDRMVSIVVSYEKGSAEEADAVMKGFDVYSK